MTLQDKSLLPKVVSANKTFVDCRGSNEGAAVFAANEQICITPSEYPSQDILARSLEDNFFLNLDDLPHMKNVHARKDYNIAHNYQHLKNITGDDNDAEV